MPLLHAFDVMSGLFSHFFGGGAMRHTSEGAAGEKETSPGAEAGKVRAAHRLLSPGPMAPQARRRLPANLHSWPGGLEQACGAQQVNLVCISNAARRGRGLKR